MNERRFAEPPDHAVFFGADDAFPTHFEEYVSTGWPDQETLGRVHALKICVCLRTRWAFSVY